MWVKKTLKMKVFWFPWSHVSTYRHTSKAGTALPGPHSCSAVVRKSCGRGYQCQELRISVPRSWGISPFLIGNTSLIRVHFPASYVSLPECSWDIQKLWRKLVKIKVKFGCIFKYNMQKFGVYPAGTYQKFLFWRKISWVFYIFLIPNVGNYSLNQNAHCVFRYHWRFAGIGGISMAGHLLIFGTASPEVSLNLGDMSKCIFGNHGNPKTSLKCIPTLLLSIQDDLGTPQWESSLSRQRSHL